MDSINGVPDNILLAIFSYLPMKERCMISRVCKKWQRVSRDMTLWRHVDFRPYRLDLRQMWQLTRGRLTPSLISLHLSGHMDPQSTTRRWNKNSLSDAMLQELATRCPNLKTLELNETNLANISLKSFPPSLQCLFINHSNFSANWFNCLSTSASDVSSAQFSTAPYTSPSSQVFLHNLTCLDLSNSVKLSDADIRYFAACWTNLILLRVKGCYRITGRGIKLIIDNLLNLVELDIGGTQCDDLTIHHLCRHLTSLATLDLSGCTKIRWGSAILSLSTAKSLKVLRLRGCDLRELSGGLDSFSAFKHLDVIDTQHS